MAKSSVMIVRKDYAVTCALHVSFMSLLFRMVWCAEFPNGRGALLAPMDMAAPSPSCHSCSQVSAGVNE